MNEKEQISVVVCDDSALMRNLVGKMVENADGLVLAGKAMNGRFLLQKLPRLQPDVIVLDLEMPDMNGIEFLKERKARGIEIPVIILSSIARRGAQVTMEALSLGASDFIPKPSGSISEDIHVVEKQLVELLRGYGQKYRRKAGPRGDGSSGATAAPPKEPAPPPRESSGGAAADTAAPPKAVKVKLEPTAAPVPRAEAGPVEILALGISTGGPNALRQVFAHLSPDLAVPIVVVQHMPAGFTTEFAKSLDRICPLEVKEAADGDILKAGRILICPGNYHIAVEKRRLAGVVRLSQDDLVNGHRPSADVLFASVAAQYAGRSMGVIMTGMGRDGAREIGSIHRKGGITLGQDEESSIVYGMPKVAAEMGHVQYIVALKDMASTISRLVQENQ
ncbi:MAG: chemotaxis response regulator protein-glutamate methylesterase [Spirochaetaceae bacterium]|nr:chemotaxis response regulator protein-glutamate methylesterase [Spirochaetaceae bacterium]MCF7949159.1 chemotaxis response regulator protein-glutamate methylesterase [Spirochaetia bacterium]MCF7951805.1 chemotaxis response regulator protein-glutamate methylesterase [Spirochaetaceae bacterium]